MSFLNRFGTWLRTTSLWALLAELTWRSCRWLWWATKTTPLRKNYLRSLPRYFSASGSAENLNTFKYAILSIWSRSSVTTTSLFFVVFKNCEYLAVSFLSLTLALLTSSILYPFCWHASVQRAWRTSRRRRTVESRIGARKTGPPVPTWKLPMGTARGQHLKLSEWLSTHKLFSWTNICVIAALGALLNEQKCWRKLLRHPQPVCSTGLWSEMCVLSIKTLIFFVHLCA